jgi:hypothetical protein
VTTLYRSPARKRTLALLDNIKIASPCKRDWDANMVGTDDRVRYCLNCEKYVYNISGMTQLEAETLLYEHLNKDGVMPPDIRLYRRADRTVMTSDCPVRGQRRRRRALQVAAAAMIVIGGAAMNLKTVANQPQPSEKCSVGLVQDPSNASESVYK